MKKLLLIVTVALAFSSASYADYDDRYRGYGGGWERHEHYRPYYYQQPPVYYQPPPVRYYQPPRVIYQPMPVYPSGNELRLSW